MGVIMAATRELRSGAWNTWSGFTGKAAWQDEKTDMQDDPVR